MKEMSNAFQVRCSGQHTYYLNLTLFIVFDNFNEQLTLINVTLHEQARTVVLKDSIEIKSTSVFTPSLIPIYLARAQQGQTKSLNFVALM